MSIFYEFLSKFNLNESWTNLVVSVSSAWNLAILNIFAYTLNVFEHFLLATVTYIVFCLFLYRFFNRGYNLRCERPFQNAERVLFVTAHPDDECMFFGPTIYKLTQNTKCKVYLLCLSQGNKEGLGAVRKTELWNACAKLGIKSENICLYNCTVLQDGAAERWRADVIASIVLRHIESLHIDTLVTFDKHGISRHPNHCSIYYSVAYLSIEHKIPKYCNVYILESINLIRKYWLIFDLPLSFILSTHRYILRWRERGIVIAAMRLHHSQYVWYRKLYVLFSRYILVNTYQRLDTIDLELDLTIDD